MNTDAELSSLQQQSQKGFREQKRLIQQVLSGKESQCPVCHGVIQVHRRPQGQLLLCCAKQCTDILLELG